MAKLCPDRQLLSVYFDGEMPSPWKEKMESHIAGCPQCARQLEFYRRVSSAAAEDVSAGEAMEAAKERVWHKLEQRIGIAAGTGGVQEEFFTTEDCCPPDSLEFHGGKEGFRTKTPCSSVYSVVNFSVRGRAVWRRRISIPLPAVAAAIVLFIALAFVVVLRITKSAESSGMTIASETEFDAPDIVPVSDMENVLQYLSSRDNGEIIIVRLPESRNFVNYGEPAIIRAADYSRQTPIRQAPGWRKP